MQGDVVDLEQERQALVETGGDQVLHDLGLAVDHDRRPCQLVHRHVVALAVELEVDAAVDDALAVEPLRHARVAKEVDGALLEHSGSDPLLHVLARAVLEDDRLDPRPGEEPRERQARGPRSDDGDLCPHAS